jgi:hypothetical protein
MMLYDQYTLLEQSSQNVACKVDGTLISMRQENSELLTQVQNMVNTPIINIAVMQLPTEMFAKQIDQETEMHRKEVLQTFPLSPKAERRP